jgi:peptidoglycan/xylan/chitin deacetylase (PgdA/CDA1 family)
MAKALYEILLGLASILRVPSRMFARAVRNQDSNLLVLLYHDVTKCQFESHLHFLDRYFEFIDLDELVRKIVAREFPSDLTVAITFDDGLQSFYHNALPIVDGIGIPVANYVTSGVVDSLFYLDKQNDRTMLWKDFKSNDRSGTTERSCDDTRKAGLEVMMGITLEELRDADRNRYITVGAHSVTHSILPELSYKACKREIFESKAHLEKMLGHSVRHFSYPYGLHTSREVALVREAGFVSAAAFCDQWISRDSTVFCFTRKGTGPSGSSISWLKYRIGK